ncbi:MAG: tetratricopeptide repeat protein [Oligoflexia bacterium]|nr:tetratricopeptide repeat protein [Oligoflexia bacterium]
MKKSLDLLSSLLGLILFITALAPQVATAENSFSPRLKLSEGATPDTSSGPETATLLGATNPQEEASNNAKIDLFSQQLQKLVSTLLEKKDERLIRFWASDLFLKASSAGFEGDSLVAGVIYQELSRLYPKDLFLKKKLVIELIKQGKVKPALAILEGFILKKESSKDLKGNLLLAGAYVSIAQYAKAQEVYKKILVNYPSNQDACLFLAKSYFENKKGIASPQNYSKADQVLRECGQKSLDANNKSIFLYYRGKLALEQKNITLAEKLFKLSLKENPEYYLSVLGLGGIYEIKSNWNQAITIYQNYLSRFSAQEVITNKLVQLLFNQGRFKEIIPHLITLSRIDPDDLNTKIKLGILYTDVGQYEAAKDIFFSLLEVVPDSDKLFFYLGTIYAETSEQDKAIEWFAKISPESSLYPEGQIQIARLMLAAIIKDNYRDESKSQAFLTFIDKKIENKIESNNSERSIASIESKTGKESNHHETSDLTMVMIKSGFLENKGDLPSAIALMKSARSIPTFGIEHEYYLAALLEKNKEYEESYAIIHGILKKDFKNAHAWNFLGYSLIERNIDLDKAFSHISKAVALSPKDGYIRDSLGWYFFKKGDLKRAQKEVEYAYRLLEKDWAICKHLAIIYHKQGKVNAAKKLYQEALERVEDSNEKQFIEIQIKELDALSIPKRP